MTVNNKKIIPVSNPIYDSDDIDSVVQTLKSGWASSEGPVVKKFEDEFSKFIGVNYSTTISNGTSALDLAFEVLNFEAGSEIILPSFTIISCLLPILKRKLIPIFIDSNLDDWNADISNIEKKITTKTKAILAVHTYGLPCNIVKIKKICKKYRLKLIEDAAEAHGMQINKISLGSFGDISTFSFYSNKHINSGEGGCVVSNNKNYIDKVNYFKNLCFVKNKRFIHTDFGYNYRMTSLQAALALSQLKKIKKTIRAKQMIGSKYYTELKDCKAIQLPLKKNEFGLNHYWVYGIIQKIKTSKINSLQSFLNKNNIATRPFFFPLHLQPILKKYGLAYMAKEKLRVAEYISKNGFYIPTGPNLNSIDQDRIIKLILKWNSIYC